MKNTPAFPNINSSDSPILVTGVPGHVGGVGTAIVEMLRRSLPVSASVLHEDERTDALRANGVEVVVTISPGAGECR